MDEESLPLNNPPRKRKRLWLVLVTVLLVIAGTIYGLWQMGKLWLPGLSASNVRVVVERVATTQAGTSFDVTLTISNRSRFAVTVSELELSNSLLADGELVSVTPKASAEIRREGIKTIVPMQLRIDAGREATVAFIITPRLTGGYGGHVSVRLSDGGIASAPIDLLVSRQPTPVYTPTVMAAAPSATPDVVVTPSSLTSRVPYQALMNLQIYVVQNDMLEFAWSANGVLVSPDGLILTTARAVSPTEDFNVHAIIVSSARYKDDVAILSWHAKIIQIDPELDIAVLKIVTNLEGKPIDLTNYPLDYATLGDSDVLKPKEFLRVASYYDMDFPMKVAAVAVQEVLQDGKLLRIGSNFTDGSVGGMALDEDGQVLGILTDYDYSEPAQSRFCQRTLDTNNDRVIDSKDLCPPPYGSQLAIRPINVAREMIAKAQAGESNTDIVLDLDVGSNNAPAEYSTDFSTIDSTYFPEVDGNGWQMYRDGMYVLRTYGNSDTTVTFGYMYDDSEVSVDVSLINTVNPAIGLSCRRDGDANGYTFVMFPTGYVGLLKLEDGEVEFVQPLLRSVDIPNARSYHLRASCIGENLSFYVNDVLIIQATDSRFQRGWAAFLASDGGQDHSEIGFDNLTLRSVR